MGFSDTDNYWIQGLWVGDSLTDLHRMCVESFLARGHGFALYTYGAVENLPPGVTIRDATQIVPSSLIYQFDGSYAGFSDLFRNKLLHANGGWYVDLDIYCLRPFDVKAEIVFSLARYDPGPSAAHVGSRPTIGEGLYVATNPCKLPRGHELAADLYGTIFKKVVFSKLRHLWCGVDRADAEGSLKRENIVDLLRTIDVVLDFETYVMPLAILPPDTSFSELLEAASFPSDEVGQKAWGEIGPLLLTRAVIARGLCDYTTPPEMFQGIVNHFDVEKYLDPTFDFDSALKKAEPYSLDLFFTMWRNKGLLERTVTGQRCLLEYMRNACKTVQPQCPAS
ncbi:MAG: hypothetical protein WCJ18_02650 [Planctomycetota bacterium]